MRVFSVEGMSCQHCVKAITNAIRVLDAAAVVTVDLANKTVSVESSIDAKEIEKAIIDEGYKASAIA